MQNSFRAKKLADFLDLLGSKAVSPGGGTAAALTAATGIALIEMVSAINGSGTAPLKVLRRRMESLMDEDAKYFLKLSALYKKKVKGSALQEALKKCAQAPMLVCEGSFRSARLAQAERSRTGRWLKSDLVEASILLEAAFQSAKLNVEANLRFIDDRKYVEGIRGKIMDWEKKWSKLPTF